MRMPGRLAWVCAWLGMTGATAAFSEPSTAVDGPLQPVKAWVLDYADAQCAAGRDYGDPQNPITLIVRPMPKGDTYELQLIRKTIGPALAEENEGSVDFGSGAMKVSALHYGSATDKLDIYQYRLSTAQMQSARTASVVTFHAAHAPDATLSLSSVPALLTGLDACRDDLQRYWNVDGRGIVKVAQPAHGDVRFVFKADDYPADAVQTLSEGVAQYLLFIDASGKVAACYVFKPSGVALLDAMGCQVLRKRAKFTPARDASGKAVRDSYLTPPVTWRLEG